MFDTAPNLWLQSWSSPSLTMAMNVVSVFGYVPASAAIAAVYGFGWRLRHGLVVLMTVAVAAVLSSAAKIAVGLPRPTDVDTRVKPLSSLQGIPGLEALSGAIVNESTFGFPSGHVATATALALGMWWRGRQRWLGAVAVWIVLMALSRIYLGRHFLADTLGGVAVGCCALALVALVFRIGRLTEGTPAPPASAPGALVAASILTIAASPAGWVPPLDAGRFAGFAAAIWLAARTGRLGDVVSAWQRAARVLLSLVPIAVATALPALVDDGAPIVMLGLALLSGAAVILLPVIVIGVSRR